MITRLMPIVRVIHKLSLLADDERGVECKKPSKEGAIAGVDAGLANFDLQWYNLRLGLSIFGSVRF
jgi:hypothetical protein